MTLAFIDLVPETNIRKAHTCFVASFWFVIMYLLCHYL